jgi:hypothetical protein
LFVILRKQSTIYYHLITVLHIVHKILCEIKVDHINKWEWLAKNRINLNVVETEEQSHHRTFSRTGWTDLKYFITISFCSAQNKKKLKNLIIKKKSNKINLSVWNLNSITRSIRFPTRSKTNSNCLTITSYWTLGLIKYRFKKRNLVFIIVFELGLQWYLKKSL